MNSYLLAQKSQSVASKKSQLPDNAMSSAVEGGFDYLVYVKVLTWTDPTGMVCGGQYLDEVKATLSLYSVASTQLLNSVDVYDRSCPAQLNGVPLSTGSPDSLFGDLVKTWVDSNFVKN